MSIFKGKFDANKLRTSLKVSINRLKLLEKKKTEMALKARKEISEFIAAGKEDRARIRVEHIVREDYLVEAMELVEMFCDLLIARMGLITSTKSIDEGLEESIATVLWAAPRLQADVIEMKTVTQQLTLKYEKDFINACQMNQLNNVSEKVMHKMSFNAPPKQLIEKYMIEIARSFNIPFEPNPDFLVDDKSNNDDDLLGPPPPGFPGFGGGGGGSGDLMGWGNPPNYNPYFSGADGSGRSSPYQTLPNSVPSTNASWSNQRPVDASSQFGATGGSGGGSFPQNSNVMNTGFQHPNSNVMNTGFQHPIDSGISEEKVPLDNPNAVPSGSSQVGGETAPFSNLNFADGSNLVGHTGDGMFSSPPPSYYPQTPELTTRPGPGELSTRPGDFGEASVVPPPLPARPPSGPLPPIVGSIDQPSDSGLDFDDLTRRFEMLKQKK